MQTKSRQILTEDEKSFLHAIRTHNPEMPGGDNIDKLKKLISKKVNVNATDADGTSALMYASQKQSLEMVRLLKENGADINAKDRRGNNALIYAIIDVWVPVVNYLLENGVDVHATNNRGFTALDTAHHIGNLKIIELVSKKAEETPIKTISATALLRRISLN